MVANLRAIFLALLTSQSAMPWRLLEVTTSLESAGLNCTEWKGSARACAASTSAASLSVSLASKIRMTPSEQAVANTPPEKWIIN